MLSHKHLSTTFRIWTAQQTWFWSVVIPERSSGAIGAVANEVQAARDARFYIEDMEAQRRAGARLRRVPARCSSISRASQSSSMVLAGWEKSLARLECYLNSISNRAA